MLRRLPVTYLPGRSSVIKPIAHLANRDPNKPTLPAQVGARGLGLLGWTTGMLSSSLAHGHLLQVWGLPDSSPSTRSWQNFHAGDPGVML